MSRTAAKPAPTTIAPLRPDGGGLTWALWLTVGYVVAMIAGFLVLRAPGATVTGNELSVERAIFTVVNAATATGFQQNVAVDAFGTSGRACVIALMSIGTLYALIAGGIAVARIARMPYSANQITRAAAIWYVLAVFAGAAMLVEPARGLLAASVQAASAFGNSGIVLGSLPPLLDLRTHLVLMPLALLGGLSIPVLLDLGGMLFGRHAATAHTRTVLGLTAGLYLLGILACFPWANLGTATTATDWSAALATASASSINARTAGLPLVGVTSLSRLTQWLIIALMVIGAAPGGAGGGLKMTTVYQLIIGTRRALRREIGLRITGIAAVWLISYVLLVAATLLALLAMQPELPADRLLFMSISAVSLAGLSQDPVSITGGGLLVLSGAMLLGRLVPLAVLWWAAMTASGEGEVAVG